MKARIFSSVPHANFALSLGLFAWGLLMAWIAFGDTPYSTVILVVASLFFLMSFGIPTILGLINDFTGENLSARGKPEEMETHTGSLRASAARLETLMPVMGVAVGFTLIGLVFISV